MSDVIESVTGKLVDIRLLVPGGKFNLHYFLLAIGESREKGRPVLVTPELREQAVWWTTALMAAKAMLN